MEGSSKIKVIFAEALERNSPEARAAYLDEKCGSQTALRTRVEALLAAHAKAGEFLTGPAFDPVATLADSVIVEAPGTIIGRYKLLEKIGEGGMAVVYMAEQQEPIRRRAALKIIKLGMDTKQVIARFEAERQALALMDHPSIAKVLDAGATETGRPYFVMELVTGVSITEYCDKNSLSTKDRLALFVQVCNAVQHAHQKGIIHRDIKPSNVMVTHHDGKPVPKVIDFGIAKATNQKLTEKTLFTRYAHIIGTPAYMSPEQAELTDLDIDTRSDIYSLGVLLYELLTGTTPFSEEELRKAGYIEMQRVIREQEPIKPSTRLTTLGEILTDVAKHRNATPDALRKAIRGDLDWIVMKSLEKDRVQRYETVNNLAEDIRRHLESEPVLARGPTPTYRLGKFLRRHRSQVLAALVLAAIATAGAVVLSLWNRDRLQLVEAERLRHKDILSQAREQYTKAEREAALETIRPILDSRHVGPEAKLLQAGILVDNRRFKEAVTILNGLLNDRLEIAGAAHALLARILWESGSLNAGRLQEIEEHRRQAEALLAETAEAYFLRAMTALTVKEQFASLDKALQLDPTHYESRRLRAFTYYASRKYDRLQADALGMTILRPRDPLGYSLRAIAWRELGRYRDAIADYDSALALTAQDSPAYIDLSTQRSETLLRMGDYERVIAEAPAETQNLTSVAGLLPALRGRDALDTQNLASLRQYHVFGALTALGDYDKATALYRQIIGPAYEARHRFRDWCAKYVFDALEAGKSWHPANREPVGAAFLPMIEAEETYRDLSAKAHRVITGGFSAQWSPEGKKLAFSMGVRDVSGVAVFDPATKETDLLIVPGKDPKWSPDGQYIAFVRNCQALRLEELTATERKEQERWLKDEEIWVMNADGTEPRRLANGGCPSWSQDSKCIYFHSQVDKVLCSISIEGRGAEAKRIMMCPSLFPYVSPDNRHVAYMEDTSLIVKDLASQALIAKWPVPPTTWGGPAWSPAGNELCMGTKGVENEMGLWIYQPDRSEPVRTLGGRIVVGAWAPDGTKLVFSLGTVYAGIWTAEYFEIWTADLDPSISAVESFGPGRTLDEHFREMAALYTRRIEADPLDASAYADRAQCYYPRDRAKADADMRRWSAVVSGKSPSDIQVALPRSIRRILSGPFGYQLVFSAERPVNEILLLNVALGQKGRRNMKSFQIPMLSMSLLGLCLLSGLDAPPAQADFTFGAPTSLGPVINSPAFEGGPSISANGLSLFFHSERSGGYGSRDIWVARRATTSEGWTTVENLGPPVNTSYQDEHPSISIDGLTLFFDSDRPGGLGLWDLWVTTRATESAPWGTPVNLGPPVNSPAGEGEPDISADGLTLFMVSNRPGGYGEWDLWVATRATVGDPWNPPLNVGPIVNSPYGGISPCLSPDGLALFFASTRPGGYGGWDLYLARRAATQDPWGPPMNLGPLVNSASGDHDANLSADGSTLYFGSLRSGAGDLWQAPIIRIAAFEISR